MTTPSPLPPSSVPPEAIVETALRIPIVEETAEVQRRSVVTGRVRIEKHVDTRTAVVDEALTRQVVRTERRPVGRTLEPGEPLPQPRTEGDAWVVPVLEEVIVVERRTVLREELLVRRVTEAFNAPQHVELRSERVEVQRLDADGRPASTAPSADGDRFRTPPNEA